MRLHRLVLTGVGPFKDRQEIDFDALSSSGLFLIEGPTGSGKTTIIDAIVFALFGVVSAGGDDVTRMRIRSHYCGVTDPTGVTCEFSVDGRRHRVSRVPAGVRDPEEPDKPAKSKGVRQTLTEFAADGSEVRVLTSRTDIEDHVEGLLRMTTEQFRQLVVLPQGQFAELLRKTPAERLASLAPLLEDGFIARVQDDLDQRGRAAQDERRTAVTAVDQSAQRLAGRLKARLEAAPPETDFTDPAIADDERRDAVETVLADITNQAEAAARARDAQAVAASALREAARVAGETLATLREIREAQEAVDLARAALAPDDLDVTESTSAARIGQLRRLEGSLEDHAAWEEQAPVRAAVREERTQQERELRESIELLRIEKASIPALRTELEQRRDAAQTLAGGLDAARTEEARITALVAKAGELAAQRVALATLAGALARAESAAVAARTAAEDAATAWEDLTARRHSGTAAALAAMLVAGEACPVCGSSEHPHPAQVAEGDHVVSDAQVEAARSAAATARSEAGAAATAAVRARQQHEEVSTSVAGLVGALGDQDEASLPAALEAARGTRVRAESALAELPEIVASLSGLDENEHSLDEQLAERDRQATITASTIAADDRAERERADLIGGMIGEAESASALLAETRSRIAALEALSEAWAALAAMAASVPPAQRRLPIETAEDNARVAHEEQAAAESRLSGLIDEAGTLASLLDDARPLAAAFADALDHRRTVEAATATSIGLAALVRADNLKRLQLRSYALQRRFEAVLAAASAHLERMSSGKFRFELNEETARAGQSGLGISLFDSWTGQPQDPKSLSGGETFYASLALALGLADVVRGEAGGSALETLFVDEGFGSLDQDTLYQVLEQLDQLRAGRRAVGVVSHVTEMKESIPDRIEVRRQADSTSIVVAAS